MEIKPPEMYYLQEIRNGVPFKKHYLSGTHVLIGRNLKAGISLNSSNISRNHAFLDWSDKHGWRISDNNSVNGLYLDGEQCEPALQYPLKPYQEIMLSPPSMTECRFQFRTSSKRKGPPLGSQSPGPSRPAEDDQMAECSSKKQMRRSNSSSKNNSAPWESEMSEDEQYELKKQLESVNSMIKTSDSINMRIIQKLNQTNEEWMDTSTQESASLIPEESHNPNTTLAVKDDFDEFDDIPDDWFGDDAEEAKRKPKKKSSVKVREDCVKPSSSKDVNECEVNDLRATVEALQKRLQEQQELLKNQEEHKKAQEEEEYNNIKVQEEQQKNIKESVNAEVASEFGKIVDSELTCVICTELFIKANTLDCGHTFCTDCITKWRKTKKDCPICRTKIKGSSKSLVIDNFTEKMVEKMSMEDQERRKEIINERLNASKKGGRTRASDRSATRSQQQATNHASTSNIPVIPIYDSDYHDDYDLPAIISQLNFEIETLEADSESESDSESEYYGRRGYYGGYGRCYNCGESGHWANGCPDL